MPLAHHKRPYMRIDYCQRFDKYGGRYLLTDRLYNGLGENLTDICNVNHFTLINYKNYSFLYFSYITK